MVNNRAIDEVDERILAAGREEMRKSGLSFSGQIVVPMEYRDTIQATVKDHGMENVPEDLLGLLEPLRNRLVMIQAGANFMTGLIGDISIPVYNGSNVAWAEEVGTAADGAGNFTDVKLQPKRLTAIVDVSKQFLLQDSNSAEALLKADIIRAVSEKLETTLLGQDPASSSSPAGIFSIVAPSGGITTWKQIVEMETTLEQQNVYGELNYVLHPAARGLFRTTRKDEGSGLFVLMNNEIDGLSVFSTNSVTKDGIIIGNWNDYVVGQWGGIDLTVDPYTQAADGKVRLVINAYFDGKPRRDKSFITGKISGVTP